MGHHPFEWQVQDISAADFNNFQKQFSQTSLQLVPFANGPVTFLDQVPVYRSDQQCCGILGKHIWEPGETKKLS